MIQVFASSESCEVSLPGDNDPYWLAHMGEGHSVSFTVPRNRNMKGMALYVVYSSTSELVVTECFGSVLIVNYTKYTLQIHNHGTILSFNDEDWHHMMSNLGLETTLEIFVTLGHVQNTVVYMICSESNYSEKESYDLEKEPNDLEKEPDPKKNSLIRFMKKIVT